MKALLQTGSSGRLPVPPEKRSLINILLGAFVNIVAQRGHKFTGKSLLITERLDPGAAAPRIIGYSWSGYTVALDYRPLHQSDGT